MAMQSDQEFAPTQIARAVFPTAFRGYDQDAVRRYLSRLAAALEHQQEYAGLGELEARTPAHERVEELESEVEGLRGEIKDLELELVQRSVNGDAVDGDPNPGAHDASEAKRESEREDREFDEHRAIELLGQETARVLESARSAAADILKRAEAQAASLKAEARAELQEAKRQAEALVAEKQTASDELVAKLAADAEATATRITNEAEEHRVAVLEESSKILIEAEELAEAEQQDAEGRAKQIVADAETLRQQVISELVAERRLAKADMDRMTTARDRLAMSLAVAKTELDEVADALVDVSTIADDGSVGAPADGSRAGDGKSHADEVEELIGTLESNEQSIEGDRGPSGSPKADTQTGAAKADADKGQGRKKRGKRRKSRADGATAANKTGSTDTSGSTAKGAGQATPAKKPVSASFDTGSARFDELKRDTATGDQIEIDLVDDAAPEATEESADQMAEKPAKKAPKAEAETGGGDDVVTGSALLMDESAAASTGETLSLDDSITEAPAAETPTAGVATEEAPADDGADEIEPAAEAENAEDTGVPAEVERQDETDLPDEVDPDEPIDLDRIIEMGLAAETIGPKAAADASTTADLNIPPADGEELSLVQGFTTIDLTDGEDIDLTKVDGAGDPDATPRSDGGDPGDGRELAPSAVTNEHQMPEEMITTVSSRTSAGQPDRTRGDLLIGEPFTGRLAKEFAARDLALARSGPNFRRQLRRALNDDQSDVLDRLRAGRGNVKVEELPAFGEQIDRYLTPLRRGLAEIAQAGATAGGPSDLSQTALDNLVRQLARYIVDKVRMPTVAILEQTTDHDRERILEPIRSLYRDFRNVGLPDLTEDALYEAFAIGLYDSIEPSAPITWVVDPRSDPDPVCEINRQRDDVVKGVVFPSGHARPLSLPGCRCLVMLADY